MTDNDALQKFLFEKLGIRGEWLRLNQSYVEAIKTKNYPEVVENLLGQTALASVMLTGTLKFEGRLSIHARGTGPITLLTSEATNNKHFRCLASYEEPLPVTPKLSDLLGQAQLAITIDPDKGQRYQGIVPLERAQMADCLAHYFELSEQLDTFFMLCTHGESAFGLMLQKLPDYATHEDQDAWNRLLQLAQTLSPEEFASTDNESLTMRLFHEESVTLFDKEPVSFKCTCSKDRSLASLEALGQEEALSILEQEAVISINCQFCGAHYEFDRAAINGLFNLGSSH